MATNETAVSVKTCAAGEDSSESEGETEPAKSFHRRFSTNKNIKSSVNISLKAFFFFAIKCLFLLCPCRCAQLCKP